MPQTITQVLAAAPHKLPADPVAHLRWVVANHIVLTEEMLSGFVFAFMEAKTFPPAGRRAAVASEEATEAIFTAALEEGMDTGRFRIEDPAFAAALIKPLLRDWYVKARQVAPPGHQRPRLRRTHPDFDQTGA